MMPEISRNDLRELLAGGRRRVHLVGVAGSGMSGLARLLAEHGHEVTGSDLGEEADAGALRQLGIRRFRGHAPEHVTNPDFVCYSSAIPSDNPELLEAQRRGIPVVRRARALAALVPPQRAIVISGTHGKTTTASMIAHVLRSVGKEPSFFVGAAVPDLGANAGVGRGPDFVIEADESDGSMAEFTPHDLVILNIEAEHLDFYENVAAIEAAFAGLAGLATGRVIYCADDPGATRVGLPLRNGVAYGTNAADGWRVAQIVAQPATTQFEVWRDQTRLGTVVLNITGRHNVSNALAALVVALGLGIEFGAIALALGRFTGARRRFDRLFESAEFLLVDDYAHHPSEISATIEAARQKKRQRLVAVFQPHRYTRTRALHRDFGRALEGADRIFVTDVYAASETPIAGVDGRLIADAVGADRAGDVTYEPSLWRLKEAVGSDLRAGDLALLMGAGNIQEISRVLAAELEIYAELRKRVGAGTVVRRYESMAKRTTLRAGGFAKLWVEPASEADLAAVLRFCGERRRLAHGDRAQERLVNVLFVGRGSNLLVRDAGISGVTIHLGPEAFSKIDEMDGGRLRIGAGVRLKQVVGAARQRNLAGLEFLEGIPGSLGGALWMNAGAMGGSIFDVVESVRVMDMDGNIAEKLPAELGVEYRACRGLREHVALAAVLKARPGSAEEIDSQLKDFERKRRASQPVAPSAGCIFKNPPGTSAGKVIDELGLKGLSFGRARVSEVHGNFIINEGGATAGDVLSLISLVQDRVRRERGIELEREVIVIGDESW